MKKILRWLCPAVFLILCVGIIWFLQYFAEADFKIRYINWDSAVKLEADGTESDIDYSAAPEVGERFRLEAVIPASAEYGNLLFETTGLELSVTLNGQEVWRSEAELPDGAINQPQAVIPLPLGTECQLVMSGSITDTENLLFPPLPRFMPVDAEAAGNYAYANYYGIPAGATAFISLMIAGVFMIGLLCGQTNYSLIPLFLAAAGLTAQWITKGMGHFFLPDGLVEFLNSRAVGLVILALLAAYLALNHEKKFWKYFGISAAASGAALAIVYIVSVFVSGKFSRYIDQMISDLLDLGDYDKLVYWATLWLVAVCAVISAYSVVRMIIAQKIEAQTLLLKNQLITDGYRAIESKMADSAALRHEEKHRIFALDALYQSGNYEALGEMLGEIKSQSDRLAQTSFTENFTVNAILQDAAFRAAQYDIEFKASASVPEKLAITENDLCRLVMNMLDNSIEAAGKAEPGKRFIRFQIELKNGFLAVKCENSFSGELKRDKDGSYLTTKEEPETHGFGLKQMNSVAERYHSILDIFTSEDNVFTVQTALKLPAK